MAKYLSTLDGDGPCDDCGGPNVVWFTDNTLWNNAIREQRGRDAILCIPCFIQAIETAGYQPTGWRLLPEWPIRQTTEES